MSTSREGPWLISIGLCTDRGARGRFRGRGGEEVLLQCCCSVCCIFLAQKPKPPAIGQPHIALHHEALDTLSIITQHHQQQAAPVAARSL